jgi:hypothetical protein
MDADNSVVQTETDDDAAFNSGLNKSLGLSGDDSITTDDVEQFENDVSEGVNEAPSAEELKQAIEKVKAFENYQAHLERFKGFDPEVAIRHTQQLFGKLGSLEQTIKELRAEPQRPELKPELFKKLYDEYPDIAESLAEDLQGILLERRVIEQQQQPFDLQPLEAAINARLEQQQQQLTQEFEKRLLQKDHPDWTQVVTSESFVEWQSKQPTEFQQQLNSTWDSAFISNALTQYKATQAAVTQKKEQRQQRLANAVVPKTSAPAGQRTTVNEEDAFNAGMKRALSIRN